MRILRKVLYFASSMFFLSLVAGLCRTSIELKTLLPRKDYFGLIYLSPIEGKRQGFTDIGAANASVSG